MIQEEKFEEAKRLYETANADQRYVLESLFPELAESEDEKIRKEIISAIKEDWPGHTDWIAWLEKQAQKPAELGENRSKELSLSLQIQAYLNTASDELYAKGKPLYSEERLEDIHKCMLMWQKLHNAYFYHNPVEWSEEDEKIISDAEVWLDTLCDYLKDSSSAYIPNVRVIISKLKSLKDRVQPQPQWKPSDEQMMYLSEAIDVVTRVEKFSIVTALKELREQLKKLREE